MVDDRQNCFAKESGEREYRPDGAIYQFLAILENRGEIGRCNKRVRWTFIDKIKISYGVEMISRLIFVHEFNIFLIFNFFFSF